MPSFDRPDFEHHYCVTTSAITGRCGPNSRSNVCALTEFEIRRITSDDGPALKGLRMRSLADAPDAFEETLEEVLA